MSGWVGRLDCLYFETLPALAKSTFWNSKETDRQTDNTHTNKQTSNNETRRDETEKKRQNERDRKKEDRKTNVAERNHASGCSE